MKKATKKSIEKRHQIYQLGEFWAKVAFLNKMPDLIEDKYQVITARN